MIIDGAFNHERLIEFFESLVSDARRKVFLILDNLSVHQCKPVKTWLAEHKVQMEVFYLPSYSPELNPEERLSADLRTRYPQQGTSADQGQVASRHRGAHEHYCQQTGTCQSLLPGPLR